MTLCPPGAWPPDKTTPILKPWGKPVGTEPRDRVGRATWVAGGGARGAIEELEWAPENRRERKRVVETVGLNFAVDRSEAAGSGALAATLGEDRVREAHGDRDRTKERAKPSLLDNGKTNQVAPPPRYYLISIACHEVTYRALARIGSLLTDTKGVGGTGGFDISGWSDHVSPTITSVLQGSRATSCYLEKRHFHSRRANLAVREAMSGTHYPTRAFLQNWTHGLPAQRSCNRAKLDILTKLPQKSCKLNRDMLTLRPRH
ncbi:hypothetical protein BHE74_00042757 [Ensete ventricosum]|nr:hypothetical protein BHE74_00042757 [Ensete ventricosum]